MTYSYSDIITMMLDSDEVVTRIANSEIVTAAAQGENTVAMPMTALGGMCNNDWLSNNHYLW